MNTINNRADIKEHLWRQHSCAMRKIHYSFAICFSTTEIPSVRMNYFYSYAAFLHGGLYIDMCLIGGQDMVVAPRLVGR